MKINLAKELRELNVSGVLRSSPELTTKTKKMSVHKSETETA